MYTPSTKRPANSSVITILLKTLIFAHLEVLDYYPGPAPAGLWRHALAYVLGDLWYRPWQRIPGDDVDLQILWTDHHPRDSLAALVGCGLDVASTPHGVDPFGREGCLDRCPRELDSVCQNKPSSLVNRSLLDPLLFLGLLLAAFLLELPLPLLLRLLLREEDVGDRYIDLGYAKANQALHPVGHVAPHGLGELGYRFSVLGRQRQVDGGLLPALPPVMVSRTPPTDCAALPPILMPSTSWDAIPAIFDTTLSEMLVEPRSVCSGLLCLDLCSLMLLPSSMCSVLFALSSLGRPACDQPVDRQQDYRAEGRYENGPEAYLRYPWAPEEGLDYETAYECSRYTDQDSDYYSPGVRPWHNPLGQYAGDEPDHYQRYYAYALSPPRIQY